MTWRNSLPRRGPVDHGRLAELLGDLLKSGQQQDHVEPEVLPRDDEEQAVEHDVGVGEPVVDVPPAGTAMRIWSSRPFGRRIWRHTTPVTTSDRMYGAKNSVRNTARPVSLALSSTRQAERERDLEQQRQDDEDRRCGVIALRNRIVRTTSPEVVEPDELVERAEPVPVVEAVPRALDDRVEHEDEYSTTAGSRNTTIVGHGIRPRLERRRSECVCAVMAMRSSSGGRMPDASVPPERDGDLSAAGGAAVMAAAASSGVVSPANSSAVCSLT